MNKGPDIESLKAGDEQAFHDLVLAFQDRVYNLCLGFVRNPTDAEDVSQEVFLEIHRSIRNFRGEASLSTYIYRITVTKSLAHLRKKKRKRWLLFFRQGQSDEAQPEANENPASDGAMEREGRKKLLLSAMEKLPENQRIALSLKCFEDLSYKEIADVMNVSVSSVESLIFRAKRNLRKHLTRHFSKIKEEAASF